MINGSRLTRGAKLKKFIEALPVGNSLIYYHLMNVLWAILLIDISDALCGHQIYDLSVAALYMHFFPLCPESPMVFTPEAAFRRVACWAQLVKTYFELEAEDSTRAERINVENIKLILLLKLYN